MKRIMLLATGGTIASKPSENGALCADAEFVRSIAAGAGSIAVGMGCGVSRALYDCVALLLSEYSGALVLDADALGALAAYGVDILKEKSCRVVLTPHLKEFSRLAGISLSEVKAGGAALAERLGVPSRPDVAQLTEAQLQLRRELFVDWELLPEV